MCASLFLHDHYLVFSSTVHTQYKQQWACADMYSSVVPDTALELQVSKNSILSVHVELDRSVPVRFEYDTRTEERVPIGAKWRLTVVEEEPRNHSICPVFLRAGIG